MGFVLGNTQLQSDLAKNIENIAVATIDSGIDWQDALACCEVVVNLAGRAHVLVNDINNPIEKFSIVICQGTMNLAKQAATAGVRRFVFISSIGLN